jgi:hypothetical protein
MNCSICTQEFIDGERIIANVRETFVFKPADVPDVKMYEPNGKGGLREVNAAAVLSPEALRESRKEHLRTEMGIVFAIFGKATLPEGAFNLRHSHCGVIRTGEARTGEHPLTKHQIRYSRQIRKSGGHY